MVVYNNVIHKQYFRAKKGATMQKKERLIALRITQAQQEYLTRASEQAGVSMSAYLRALVLRDIALQETQDAEIKTLTTGIRGER